MQSFNRRYESLGGASLSPYNPPLSGAIWGLPPGVRASQLSGMVRVPPALFLFLFPMSSSWEVADDGSRAWAPGIHLRTSLSLS